LGGEGGGVCEGSKWWVVRRRVRGRKYERKQKEKGRE